MQNKNYILSPITRLQQGPSIFFFSFFMNLSVTASRVQTNHSQVMLTLKVLHSDNRFNLDDVSSCKMHLHTNASDSFFFHQLGFGGTMSMALCAVGIAAPWNFLLDCHRAMLIADICCLTASPSITSISMISTT